MTMVERVARAIYHCQPRNKPYEVMEPVHRRYWEKRAEAAILAMREPARGMIGAGGIEQFKADMAQSPAREATISIYRAMIDAALDQDKSDG